MKILVVMSRYPFPPRTGGAIVACNSIKHLSRRHAVDLMCLQPMPAVTERAQYVRQLKFVPHEKPSKWAIRLGMLAGIPDLVTAVACSPMKESVKEAALSGGYDAIVLFEMDAIQYCPPAFYHKLIAHIEDPLSIKLGRMAKLPIWSLRRKTILHMQAALIASYERKMLPKIAKVLLLSTADMEDMQRRGGYTNLSYMPYAVAMKDSTGMTDFARREKAIVFSGNMYHPPNVDGALWFLRDVFPLVLQEFPAATFWIVGSSPDKRIIEASKPFGERVLITGRVDDISAYIKRACVSICPVRLKIGVQTKILEAMACGTPVVTTHAGNSGIKGVSGVHLFAEDEPAPFARKVSRLLQGSTWKPLAEAGRKLAAETFSWEESVGRLEGYLTSLAKANAQA